MKTKPDDMDCNSCDAPNEWATNEWGTWGDELGIVQMMKGKGYKGKGKGGKGYAPYGKGYEQYGYAQDKGGKGEKGKGAKGKGKGDAICYNCGHTGHVARHCEDMNPFQGTCSTCGAWGHTQKGARRAREKD